MFLLFEIGKSEPALLTWWSQADHKTHSHKEKSRLDWSKNRHLRVNYRETTDRAPHAPQKQVAGILDYKRFARHLEDLREKHEP